MESSQRYRHTKALKLLFCEKMQEQQLFSHGPGLGTNEAQHEAVILCHTGNILIYGTVHYMVPSYKIAHIHVTVL